MRYILLISLMFFGVFANGQRLTADRISVRDSIILKGVSITQISSDSALSDSSNRIISTQAAVKNYVDSKLKNTGNGDTANIYNHDGTLTSDRVIDGNGKSLSVSNLSQEYHSISGGLDYHRLTNGGNFMVISSDDTHAASMAVAPHNGGISLQNGSGVTASSVIDVTDGSENIYQYVNKVDGPSSSLTQRVTGIALDYTPNLPEGTKYTMGHYGVFVDSLQTWIGDNNGFSYSEGGLYTVGPRAGIDKTGFYVSPLPNADSMLMANGFPSHGLRDSAYLRVQPDTVAMTTKNILLTKLTNSDGTKFLTTDATGKVVLAVAGSGGSYINNSSTNQAGAVFNVDHAIISQAARATNTLALSVLGGPGTAPAIPGAGVNIQLSFGGNTTSGTTKAAAGGGFSLYLGAGGANSSSSAGAVAGDGGACDILAGTAGSATNAAVSGTPGYIRMRAGVNNNVNSGDGGVITLAPGTHASGSNGRDGDVFLCADLFNDKRIGRAIVGTPGLGALNSFKPNLNTNLQAFQVYGPSLLNDTVTMANTPALGTPANNFLTSNNGIIQTRTAAQVVADIGAAPWYDYISRTAQASNPPAIPSYTGDLNNVLNNAVAGIDQTAGNTPAGRAGFLFSAGNNSGVTAAKYQIYGGTQNDDFWYRYGADGGPWGTWYQGASRTWVSANFAPATNIRTITASYTATAADYTIINKATTGTPVLTLPAASANTGKVFNIVEEAGNPTANGIVFSAVYYKGATYTSFNNPTLSAYSRITVQSDGTDWVVISSM